MRALTEEDILQVWERGQRQHPIDRALTLLGAASPATTRPALAALSIGRRDARLLALHAATFGAPLQCVDVCPTCASPVEFFISSDELLVESTTDADDEASSEPQLLRDGDHSLSFRLPTSFDLAAVVGAGSPEDARRRLVQRCVTSASENDEPIATDCLPEDVVRRLAEAMSTLDPQAEIVLGLTCPECGHRWSRALDIVEFFWSELAAQAQRVLADVHTLARSYGWHELDILSMSSARRQFYLDMVGV